MRNQDPDKGWVNVNDTLEVEGWGTFTIIKTSKNKKKSNTQ